MGNERFIFGFWESPTTGWHTCKVKKCLHLTYNMHVFFLPYLLNDSQTNRLTIHFFQTSPLHDANLQWLVLLVSFPFHHACNYFAVFVSAVLLCVQLYRGNCYFTAPKVAPSGKEWISISRPTLKRPQVGGKYANVSCWCQHETARDLF